VSCVLRGEGGDSGVLHLGISTEHVDKFERGQTDSFDFNVKVWRPTACGRALHVGNGYLGTGRLFCFVGEDFVGHG
jgi:hypothetical protein